MWSDDSGDFFRGVILNKIHTFLQCIGKRLDDIRVFVKITLFGTVCSVRYTPTNAYGKRESHNIYAKTREECEEKLAEMIAEVKAQIKAEKEKMTG